MTTALATLRSDVIGSTGDFQGAKAGAVSVWSLGWPLAGTCRERISNVLSFEPDEVSVALDGRRLKLSPGQDVIAHGVDRNLTVEEVNPHGQP
jgi:hypothetical protein